MKAKSILSGVISLVMVLVFFFMGCSAQTPLVQQGNPESSFFSDQVTYPYRVSYADARAGDGTVWNIGYMDVKPLFKTSPKVLVLIHGRAFNGAYFGHAVEIARKHGIRVVVPDLPHYGKSIPGNLDKPLVRSMQQAREAIYDLVVNRLGITEATYGGHSLGGQFVLGYALSYPEAVERLILIAPAGLEELPSRLFPPELAESTRRETFARFPYYARKARLDFSTNPQLVEDYFFYRLRVNGKLIPSGFFRKETPDAMMATAIRTGMITGNPDEFQRHAITSLRDVYNLGVEIQKEDPESLFKRYDRIRAPILLIFGEEEPFYPKKVSGLKDLKQDMIKPFCSRMTTTGCPVAVKLYPGSGHFPHTDFPDLFADDVVRFVSTGKVHDTADPNSF